MRHEIDQQVTEITTKQMPDEKQTLMKYEMNLTKRKTDLQCDNSRGFEHGRLIFIKQKLTS